MLSIILGLFAELVFYVLSSFRQQFVPSLQIAQPSQLLIASTQLWIVRGEYVQIVF